MNPEEVKKIIYSEFEKNGIDININKIFVSCVSKISNNSRFVSRTEKSVNWLFQYIEYLKVILVWDLRTGSRNVFSIDKNSVERAVNSGEKYVSKGTSLLSGKKEKILIKKVDEIGEFISSDFKYDIDR